MYLQIRDASASNSSTNALQVFCGYPLSGHYEVMPRVVIYPLMIAAIWSRTALLVVMLWTSLAAIHVVALSASQSSAVLDADLLLATHLTFLGLTVAQVYIIHSWGLKGSGRADMFTACLWMVLLWTGMVSYTVTTRFQPVPMPCVDSHHHNVSARSMLSECTLQCHGISTDHPTRLGQSAVLITKPSAIFYGNGRPGYFLILIMVILSLSVLGSFWLAKQKDVWASVKRHERAKKKLKEKSVRWAYCFFPYKFALLFFFALIWTSERGFRHLPTMERDDTIGQWGPLVVLALVMFGLLFRTTIGKKYLWTGAYPTDPQPRNSKVIEESEKRSDEIAAVTNDVRSDHSTTLDLSQPEQAHVPGGWWRTRQFRSGSSNARSLAY